MAKSVQERCNKILGVAEGSDYFQAVGSFKEGEETKYQFGVYLTLPAKMKNTGDADLDKICLLWAKRMVSADNAGLPAKLKEGNITAEEAEATLLAYNGEGFLVKLNEVKVRQAGEKEESRESQYIKELASVLRDKSKAGYDFATAKVKVPRHADPPKTEKGHINFVAWAKIVRDVEHPWYDLAVKAVDKRADKYA